AELVGGRSSIEAPGVVWMPSSGAPRKPLPRTGALTALGPAVPVSLYAPVGVTLVRHSHGDEVLSPQPEPLDQRTVAGNVGALQVVEQPAAPADEQQQSTTAVVVVLVHLEVLGQVGDPLGQHRDLDLGRPGVTLGGGVLGKDLGLLGGVERHILPLRLHGIVRARGVVQAAELPPVTRRTPKANRPADSATNQDVPARTSRVRATSSPI